MIYWILGLIALACILRIWVFPPSYDDPLFSVEALVVVAILLLAAAGSHVTSASNCAMYEAFSESVREQRAISTSGEYERAALAMEVAQWNADAASYRWYAHNWFFSGSTADCWEEYTPITW